MAGPSTAMFRVSSTRAAAICELRTGWNDRLTSLARHGTREQARLILEMRCRSIEEVEARDAPADGIESDRVYFDWGVLATVTVAASDCDWSMTPDVGRVKRSSSAWWGCIAVGVRSRIAEATSHFSGRGSSVCRIRRPSAASAATTAASP